MDLHAALPHILSSRSHVPGPTQRVCLLIRAETPKGNEAVPDGDGISPHPASFYPCPRLPVTATEGDPKTCQGRAEPRMWQVSLCL